MVKYVNRERAKKLSTVVLLHIYCTVKISHRQRFQLLYQFQRHTVKREWTSHIMSIRFSTVFKFWINSMVHQLASTRYRPGVSFCVLVTPTCFLLHMCLVLFKWCFNIIRWTRTTTAIHFNKCIASNIFRFTVTQMRACLPH